MYHQSSLAWKFSHKSPPPSLSPHTGKHFISFTYCNDRFSNTTTTRKLDKHVNLISHLTQFGWYIQPTIPITIGVRARVTPHLSPLSLKSTPPPHTHNIKRHGHASLFVIKCEHNQPSVLFE